MNGDSMMQLSEKIVDQVCAEMKVPMEIRIHFTDKAIQKVAQLLETQIPKEPNTEVKHY